MNLVTIACIGKNNELGANNDLIWKFKEDLQTFRKITTGHRMVMGLNTFKSLPGLLPGRKHLVIADQEFEHPPEVEVFSSIDDFLAYAEDFINQTGEDIFVIGGGMIYKQLLPYSNKLILTEVNDTSPTSTIFFPKFDKTEFTLNSSEDYIDEKTGISYSRKTYTRNKF